MACGAIEPSHDYSTHHYSFYDSTPKCTIRALRRYRGSLATLVGHWMGDQKFIISSSYVLRKAR
jgi:hypothetical protein